MTKNKKDKDYNLEFEESTKHRDKLKNKKHGIGGRAIRSIINTINAGIRTYNNTIARIPRVNKLNELNPDQTAEEIAESGASVMGVGMIDDAVKFIRRVVIPGIQTGGLFTGAIAFGVSTSLASIEFSIDKLKDLMVSGALSGIGAEVGDLKDGQARLGKSVNAHGKKIKEVGDKLDGVGNRVGNLEGEMEGLGDRVGSLEEGLGSVKEGLNEVRNDINGLKSDFQTQGRELKQAMGEMKSELQEQIQQQSQLFDHKLQQQDAKFTQEISRVDSEIANLHGELREQKMELKAEIQQKNEETKQQLRQEMSQQRQELENQIKNITLSQSRINQEIQEHISEIDQTLEMVEKRTLQNARKIFEEKLERERKDQELADAIKTTNTKLNDLQQKKQELTDNFNQQQAKLTQQTTQTQQDLENLTDQFSQLQGQTNQKAAQTQQGLESLEQEYTKQTKILNTKIADQQDRLEDYQQEQWNLKFAQKKLNQEFQELAEEAETQAHLMSEHTTKLEFVARGMEEIAEETHERLTKLHEELFDLNEQTEEALFTAQKAARKIDNLTEELAQERERIKELEQQIERNKLETKKARSEAELANERLDNLLKTQQLSDFTEQELAFNKLKKTLQLKADEAKLLAQLNLLQYVQTTALPEELAEKEWKVGIEKGTARELPCPEGYPLDPNSRWTKEYSEEELREWGWDTRIKGEHETAPLTTPEKRKQETTQTGGETGEPQETELNEEIWQQIEETKSKLLEQLAEIQGQIGQNLEAVENQEKKQSEPEKKQVKANLAHLEAQEKALRKQRAQAKAQLTHEQKQQQATKKEVTQLKSAVAKETKKLEQIERKLTQPTTFNQRQELQASQQEIQQQLAQFQEQIQEKQAQLTQQSQQTEQSEQNINQLSQQIESTQTQSQQARQSQAEQAFQAAAEQAQAEAAQAQQELLQQEWEEIKEIQEEISEDAPAPTPPPVAKLMEEEAAQAAAASSASSESSSAQEKQMTLFMLYLIIFLLEYIVYKRNGLPGLVILNICLAIAYYHKDTLMEYVYLWDKYVLIIGYVMGNVLAYSAPEQEKYKWPSVIGFNAIIALIYAYTWYQKRQIAQASQKQVEKIHQDTSSGSIVSIVFLAVIFAGNDKFDKESLLALKTFSF